MRQGNSNNKQQQQRMRGRGGNNGGGNTNRKGPNPLNRSYESTGPDVKIRGTALHIAEKYVQLARDAQSGGDRVLAESYLQHAEHYYRIIAAAQAQMQQPITVVRSDIQVDDDDDDDLDTAADVRATASFVTADAPQPFIEDASTETVELTPRGNGDRSLQDRQSGERPQRDRFGRERSDRYGSDRSERGERTDGERNDRNRMSNNGQRGYRGGSDYRSNGMRNGNGEGRGDTGQGDAQGNRFEPSQNDAVRADAARLENRTEGRPEYRSDRGDRFGNRGERPMRERPQYRSERGDRPERGNRYEGERREARAETFESTDERSAEPVVTNELPAFITGIQPRSEARSERPPRVVERFEEPAPVPVAAPVVAPAPIAPAPVVAEPAPVATAAVSTPGAESVAEAPAAPAKRPRGRPRKVPIDVAPVPVADE